MSKGRHNNDNTDDSYPSTGPWGTPNILEEFGSEGDDKFFVIIRLILKKKPHCLLNENEISKKNFSQASLLKGVN